MKTKNKLRFIQAEIEKIIKKAEKLEFDHSEKLSEVHPEYKESSYNLLHYLAFRNFDIDELQQHLRYLGLPDLANVERHVMRSLLTIQNIVNKLLDNSGSAAKKKSITIKKSEKLLRRNTKSIVGNKSNKRNTRIMVTLPSEAAEDYRFVNQLMKNGMNCARINCAHDDEEVWAAMIDNVKRASKGVNRKCQIMMDLGGPKLRTGSMRPGPQVVRIKPQRDLLGKVVQPSRVWIAPPNVPAPNSDADAVIPVNGSFVEKIKRGNRLFFVDSRGRKCQIEIIGRRGKGRWGLCHDSAYITTGTELLLHKIKKSGKEKNHVGELLPVEEYITLFVNDKLVLHSSSVPGEPASYDEQGNLIKPAHISCTLPEAFQFLKKGESVFLNDGKIEGVIENVKNDEIEIVITNASLKGSKLRADKGINFPDSDIDINGLTEKDKADIPFIANHADAVNLSFVNNANDVKDFQEELKKHNVSVGTVLKIETKKGYKNLPEILLQAMQSYPVGIMLARGDLAIETRWESFANIQEEILRLGEAVHIPVIWATQVLESLAKKGVPTRSEITDAALAQRAECVMLNKGRFVVKALKTLNKILIKMQSSQNKRHTTLPKLKKSNELTLIYDETENIPVV